MPRMLPRVICLCIVFASAVLAQDQEATPTLSGALANIRSVANSFPPRIESPEHRAEIEAQWRWVEEGLLAHVATLDSPEPASELLLGDLYRMGYNLDIEGCGPKAIERLQRASELDPQDPRPHHLLGRHYTYSAKFAKGEIELLWAYSLAGPDDGHRVLFDLTWNSYLQKKYALATLFADRYLEGHPSEPAILGLRKHALEALETGRAFRTIEIETDSYPDKPLGPEQHPVEK